MCQPAEQAVLNNQYVACKDSKKYFYLILSRQQTAHSNISILYLKCAVLLRLCRTL